MTNQVNLGTEKYQAVHRRKSLWLRVISILSAVTVFVTTYAMILPAITMEPSPGVVLAQQFWYEDDRVQMLFYVKGRAVFQQENQAVENPIPANVRLAISPLKEDSSVYQQYLQYAQENIGSEEQNNESNASLLE